MQTLWEKDAGKDRIFSASMVLHCLRMLDYEILKGVYNR